MSNRKLTTEEKIEKSRQYEEDMKRIRERLADIRESKKKLDSEIAEEMEKEYIHNMQELGKRLTEKIGADLPQEQCLDILDYIFIIDEVSEYIEAEREQFRKKAEAAERPKAATA